MKTIAFKFLLTFVLCSLLGTSSCLETLKVTSDIMSQHSKGLPIEQTKFNSAKPIFKFQYSNDSKDSFSIYVYKEMYNIDIKDWRIENSSFNICAAIYKNDSLYYWGLVDNFKKDPNPTVQKIGEEICDTLIINYWETL